MSLSTSPFPPIADYAFLSNCHTGALVAPDGSVDWLCVPAFDSPSAFGNLLDRGAGSFRFGPYGINQPTARTYVPGTNVMTTTWHTPGGWLLVHDALTMGPRQGPDVDHPAHQATRRRRRRTPAGAHGRVPGGLGRGRVGLRAGVRLRPRTRRLDAGRRPRPCCRRLRSRADPPAEHRHVDRHRGQLCPRAACAVQRSSAPSARCHGPTASPRPRTSTTPRRASRRPSGSGATGSPGPASPTTRCGIRSSAPRSRSRV